MIKRYTNLRLLYFTGLSAVTEWMPPATGSPDVDGTAEFGFLCTGNVKQFEFAASRAPQLHLSLNSFEQDLKSHLLGQQRTSTSSDAAVQRFCLTVIQAS